MEKKIIDKIANSEITWFAVRSLPADSKFHLFALDVIRNLTSGFVDFEAAHPTDDLIIIRPVQKYYNDFDIIAIYKTDGGFEYSGIKWTTREFLNKTELKISMINQG